MLESRCLTAINPHAASRSLDRPGAGASPPPGSDRVIQLPLPAVTIDQGTTHHKLVNQNSE